MSCTCLQIPCCCPRSNDCSETITYTFENANLAGVGVFGAEEDFLVRFRGVGSGDAFIDVAYNNVTKVIEISLNDELLKTQQTFVDNAARASATPAYLGQLGFQTNSAKLYYGSSLAAGGWTLVSAP